MARVFFAPLKLAESLGPEAAAFKEGHHVLITTLMEMRLTAMLANRKSIPKVPVTVKDVFHGCALALARRKPSLAGTWKDVTRKFSFDWSTKRHTTWGVKLAGDGSDSLLTMPISQSKLDESEGHEPVDFDRTAEITDERGRTVTIAGMCCSKRCLITCRGCLMKSETGTRFKT
jgi:hypothetical protein